MTIKPLLDQYAAYDLWANTRFVQRLQREPADVLDRPVPNSFPSLRATLLHIRDAENAWRCRLTGVKAAWPAESDTSIDTLLKHSTLLRDLVLGMDGSSLASDSTYLDLRGNAHTQQAWSMLMHCFNHSTQHRGQVITLMRTLGLDEIPANDLVVYQRTLTT
ncbi:MAG: DinB family protein [Flavobacteriales bacterium]